MAGVESVLENEQIVLADGISLPSQLSLKTQLYPKNSIVKTDVELFLVYDASTGRFAVDPRKTCLEDPALAEQTFSPVSVLIMQGHKKEAVALAEVELVEKPNSFEAWNMLAVALSWNGDHEEALKASNKAIGLAPDQAYLYQNKALTLASLGRFDEAIESIDQRIKMEPDFIYAHALKAGFLKESGLHLEAMQSFEKALTTESKLEWADEHRRMVAKELGFDSVDDALKHVREKQDSLSKPDADPKLEAPVITEFAI